MIPFLPLKGSPEEIWNKEWYENLAFKVDPLPIKGGWGYCQEDPCIIEGPEPMWTREGIAVENEFALRRIRQEIGDQRPKEAAFILLECSKQAQTLVSDKERHFDMVEYRVKALRVLDWLELLKIELETQIPYKQLLAERADALVAEMTSVFWFDITAFYGDRAVRKFPTRSS